MEEVFQVMGIPLLFALIVLYFAIRTLVFHDTAVVIGKGLKVGKDEPGYIKTAGYYLLGYSICMAIYAVLLYYNYYIAFALMIVATIGIIWLWRRLNEKHDVKRVS